MADTNTLSFPFFHAAKNYFTTLAIDELVSFFVLGAIAAAIFWFIMGQFSIKAAKIGKKEKWFIWITMTCLFSIPLMLGFDLLRYLSAKANQATTELQHANISQLQTICL